MKLYTSDIDDVGQDSLVNIMLEFVRSAVLERNPIIPQHIVIDWDRLMDLSVEQGLVAWVWDGICKLPIDSSIPRQQRINWALSAQSYWDGYEKNVQVLDYMIRVCQQNSIKLLLLKGVGLSLLYPKPQSRPVGDIDVFLFKDFQKGNIIFYGKRVVELSKHTTWMINGVEVDNHRNFFEPTTTQKRKLNRYIKSTLDNVQITPNGYYLLAPLPNLLFLCLHTLKHFYINDLIPIRSIIDFAFFLNNNKVELKPNECKRALERMHLIEGFELLICLSELILNITISDYHFYALPQKYLDELKSMILQNSYELSNEFKQEIPKEYLLRYVPKDLDRAHNIISPFVWMKSLIRLLFFIPKGESFHNTLKSRFYRNRI